jgi:hypothetical protein
VLKSYLILGQFSVSRSGEDVGIKRSRKTKPTGKVHKVFKEVSKLAPTGGKDR